MEWHLRGRAGRRQLAVIRAEMHLEEFAVAWAADQCLRIFDWRAFVADRRLWERVSRSFASHTLMRVNAMVARARSLAKVRE